MIFLHVHYSHVGEILLESVHNVLFLSQIKIKLVFKTAKLFSSRDSLHCRAMICARNVVTIRVSYGVGLELSLSYDEI